MTVFTIRDALGLAAFEQATLVAGKNGVDNAVRRVHIVDMPDATYAWAQGGELLLTAGAGLHQSPERQRDLIPQLVSKKLSGLGLSIGHYFQQTPPSMLASANALDFPIIELPPDVPFIDLTEAIFTQLLDRQHVLRERAAGVHRTLTELVLDGGSLDDLARALASILQRSITIESAAFDVLAAAKVGEVDEARTRSVSRGRTAPDVARHLVARGIYERLLKERRPTRIDPIPELGMHMERIVAPIIVAHDIIGYVWIIAGERPLNGLDELAVEHAATVAALIMFTERAVNAAEMTLRGDFFAQLLDVSDTTEPGLVERAHQLDFSLSGYYQVLLLHNQAAAGEGQSTLHHRIEHWLRDQHPALVAQRDQRVVVVLHGKRPIEGETIAKALIEKLRGHPAETLVIGIGQVIDNVPDLRRSYNQAAETLDTILALNRQEGIMSFDQLGLLYWLRHLPQGVLHENKFLNCIYELATYDKAHQSHLLETLETYLDMGTTSRDAANKLSVHRNTLAYRLERIEDLMNLDLRDPDCRINLHVAIKSYRLHSNQL